MKEQALGLDAVLAEIEETGYFEDPDIIPCVVHTMTAYSQGYLLVTPDIQQPVGVRWTTNGYLQRDYIRVSATYRTQEEAAEALLRAINSINSED